MPSLLYVANSVYVPEVVIKELKQIVVDFIWDGGSSKVAYNHLIQSIDKGGLKLTDFESKLESFRVKWISRLINLERQSWTAFPKLY